MQVYLIEGLSLLIWIFAIFFILFALNQYSSSIIAIEFKIEKKMKNILVLSNNTCIKWHKSTMQI